MARKPQPEPGIPPIDPRSDAVVLEYVEGAPRPAGVPARDLHGGDIARVAYERALRAYERPRDPETGEALEPTRPGAPSDDAISTVAAELVASGSFRVATPAAESPSETQD